MSSNPASLKWGNRVSRRIPRPIFFFQAENDYDHPAAPFTLMQATGKSYEVIIYPTFGDSAQEGHSIAYLGSSGWGSDVFRFPGRHPELGG